jgi:hypothetical protein
MIAAGRGGLVSVALLGACGGAGADGDLFRNSPRSVAGGTSAGRGGSTASGDGLASAAGGDESSGGMPDASTAGSGDSTDPDAGEGGTTGDGREGSAGGGATSFGGSLSHAGAVSAGGSPSGGAANGGVPAEGGSAGEAASSAQGGLDAGGAIATGGAPSCTATCGPNGSCTESSGTTKCECHTGFIAEGSTCRLPVACRELHSANPALSSGAYALRPSLASQDVTSYCEMSAEGGGWTLVLNENASFDPQTLGANAELAYESSGTNLSYSTVLLESDVMLDVRLEPIAAAVYTARAVITGVHAQTRGRTVRDLFNSGPNYLEAEDNSNLVLRSSIECGFSPLDLSPLFCTACNGVGACAAPVIVFGDHDPSCGATQPFAISGAQSYTQPWDNCAGWPQAPVADGQRHFPDNFRVWIR